MLRPYLRMIPWWLSQTRHLREPGPNFRGREYQMLAKPMIDWDEVDWWSRTPRQSSSQLCTNKCLWAKITELRLFRYWIYLCTVYIIIKKYNVWKQQATYWRSHKGRNSDDSVDILWRKEIIKMSITLREAHFHCRSVTGNDDVN